mgnify:CR=1 FL=1
MVVVVVVGWLAATGVEPGDGTVTCGDVTLGAATVSGVVPEGLGWIKGEVRAIEPEDKSLKIPHMGWNTVRAGEGSTLFRGVEDERFYFVHSFAAQSWELDVMPPFPQPRLTWAEHGSRFLAAIENGPLSATQFHPEKSGEAGIQLLRNWIATL